MNDQPATEPSDAAPASPPAPPPDTSWYAVAAAMETGTDAPSRGEVAEPHRALGFGEAVGACLRQYATFSGRAQRSEYWWWVLFHTLALMALVGASGVAGAGAAAQDVVAAVAVLVLLLPSVAVTVRRLHDIGRSGWWVLVGLVPIVGSIILLVFAWLPGTLGPNRFGPPPTPSSRVWR